MAQLTVATHLTGIFPRSEQLVEITRAFDRGKASESDVADAFERDASSLIKIQNAIAFDWVVDGQLNWQDLFRPFSEILTGITPGGLTRWFDNNTFYRRPVVKDKLRVGSKAAIDRYFRSSLLPAKRKKAILPGAFTFATASQNEAYSDTADLVDDAAHALREVAVELRGKGYDYFQFSEPHLRVTTSKSDLEAARKAYDTLGKSLGSGTLLQTYFSDVSKILGDLLNFSVDCIGVDLYATPVESVLEYKFTKELSCGCVDGRNSLIESPADLASLVEKIQSTINPRRLLVSSNCDLEFLPYPVAEKKLQVLAELKRRVD